MEKIKLIVDTDPGVDDIAALMMFLFDKKMDVKLITTVSGNRPVDITTRNTLHFLEKFNLDVPVAVGAAKPMFRERIDAADVHGKEGMGKYIPKEPEYKKPIQGSAEDNMYKVICENPHEITLVLLGPQTNAGLLLTKYPDAAKLLKQIVFMGGSPYGYKKTKPHISFNISSDPEAFEIVLKSGIKLIMIPSELGRRMAHLTDKQVEEIGNLNDVGKFLHTMYMGYWEPGFTDKRISTNDSCVYLYLSHPKIFKLQKGDITVLLEQDAGKTYIDFNKSGKQNIIMKVNGKRTYRIIKSSIIKLNNYKLN